MLLLEDLDLLTKTGAGRRSVHGHKQDNWHKLCKRKRVELASGDERYSRSGLLVLERLKGNSLDAHDV